jgi:hypothetical protein
VKYAFIQRNRRVWPISVQCRVLGVSVAGYHEHLARRRGMVSRRHLSNEGLLVHIRAVHVANRGAYRNGRAACLSRSGGGGNLERRRAQWQPPVSPMKGGYQPLCAERVMEANTGADLDLLQAAAATKSRASRTHCSITASWIRVRFASDRFCFDLLRPLARAS